MKLLSRTLVLFTLLLSTPLLAKPLQIVAPLEVSSMEPDQNGYLFTRLQVAETLVSVDKNGQLSPLLATEWHVSADGLTWRFTIRPHVQFHDGSELNTRQVKAALDKARRATGVLSQAPIRTIEAHEQVVLIHLHQAFAPLPAYLANYSTQILAPSAYDANGKVIAVIGTGPYQVNRIAMPLKVDLQRYPHYWQTPAQIEQVHYLAVGKGETRALMAQSGEADLVISLLPMSVASIKRAPKLDVQLVTLPRTRMLKLNAASPFFQDARVRQALSLGLDRQGMAQAILRNPALAATQLFPPTVQSWHDPELPDLAFNLEKARALLAEAGWKPGSDGILTRENQPFRVTLTTFSSWPELPVLATAIQAQWRKLGIDLAVSVGNSSEIVSKHRDGSLQIGLLSRNFSLTPDPVATMNSDFGPQGGDWGAMGWSDQALTQHLDQLLSGHLSPEAQQSARHQIVKTLQQQLPVIPLAWTELVVVSSKQLKNVYVDPFELSYHIAQMQWK